MVPLLSFWVTGWGHRIGDVLMTLADRLEADLKKAMRAGDAVRVSTIRLARAAIHNLAIERGRPPTDEEIVEVLRHEMKRRREAIEAYTKGRRDDLVRKESLELAILTEYVPAPLSTDELQRIVVDAIAQVEAKEPRDVGRVMAVVMPKVKGRADGNAVSQLVRELLGAGR
jgi:uncharacterized protein YqeY